MINISLILCTFLRNLRLKSNIKEYILKWSLIIKSTTLLLESQNQRDTFSVVSVFSKICSTQVKSEHLVVHVVALSASLLQQEGLSELERLLLVAVDEKTAGDKDENPFVDRGLVVRCG